jgi:NhaA family Na+:H+ antiporter
MKTKPIDKILQPLQRFMDNSSSSGLVLFGMAFLALILANTPLSSSIEEWWKVKIGLSVGEFQIKKSLLLWINDGLMSIFFFVVGLELKRELTTGQLSNPRNALLPFIAGLGGMLVPAAIYTAFNYGLPGSGGWGIPMATDIAFALGVLYLLGDRVPLSLKVFLTALAIIDDLGAVTIIAIFYTEEINLYKLLIAAFFLGLMLLGNFLGIRNAFFYGVLGIGGLWLAILLSGVHATIAAVLAAFTIPATIEVPKSSYVERIEALLRQFSAIPASKSEDLNEEEQAILEEVESTTHAAISPLQHLEHTLHPIVAFVVMPIFALANAGVSFSGDVAAALSSPITLGVGLGLLLGKVTGILGFVLFFKWLGWVQLPPSMSLRHLTGGAFLAGIGFTMSLFITSLAFEQADQLYQAKMGILIASLFTGLIGYSLLRSGPVQESND